jgi:hypothetical protein
MSVRKDKSTLTDSLAPSSIGRTRGFQSRKHGFDSLWGYMSILVGSIILAVGSAMFGAALTAFTFFGKKRNDVNSSSGETKPYWQL